MTTNLSRKETERTKLIQEKCQTLLTQMLRDEDNKYCVDCDAKGPRWASWNLGVFLCIRCAGIHRNLGVHISRVKSVNLDTWTPEQVISLQQMGNSRARAVYEAQLPDGFRRPQTDNALESFIRAKYEHKKYLAREWVPPAPPKVDWAKEIDEELEKQKRKKKAAQANSVLGIGVMSGGSSDKKSGINTARTAPLPAPLPKPKPGQSGASPKSNSRLQSNTSSGNSSNNVEQQQCSSNDLLGLTSPTKPNALPNNSNDLHNDSFSGFLSAPCINSGAAGATTTTTAAATTNEALSGGGTSNSSTLAQEEEDFFKQCSLGGAAEKDKSGKLTKDSILALYATVPTAAAPPTQQQLHYAAAQQQQQQQQQQHQQQLQQQLFVHNNFAGGNALNFTGMTPGFMGTAAAQQQQQQQHAQFMTPPNSASMYNAPVMTAPNAFSASNMAGGGAAAAAGFGAQFPNMSAYGTQMPAGMMQPQSMLLGGAGGGGGGIMATGQPNVGLNLMQSNQQSRLGGHLQLGNMQQQQQQQQHLPAAGMGGFGALGGLGGIGSGGMFQSPAAAGAGNANNLNQQFGNLNIGNVWQ